MNLKQHPSAIAAFAQRRIQAHHRHFDQVGGGALNARVDRFALGGLTTWPATAFQQLAEIAPSAKQGFNVALTAHHVNRLINILF